MQNTVLNKIKNDNIRIMSNENFPPAYFITFTTYGNWMHGDARESIDPKHNQFLTPRIKQNKNLQNNMREKMRGQIIILNELQRETVLKSIIHASNHYHWRLYAAHVRTNHIHILINAMEKPDRVTTKIKSFATRFLKTHHPEIPIQKLWARGKSARYVWDLAFLSIVHNYIIEEQGKKMACYSDRMFNIKNEFYYDF